MSRPVALTVLFVAALLEASGDAFVRKALHASGAGVRLAYFVVGALTLFAYGYVVNRPPWEFGRLLGIYIVLFFVVAQAMSWLMFSQQPTTPVMIGGACVIAGGIIMTIF